MSRIKEYPSITSFDGTNDALAIEQTDGANNRTRKVSPAQLKQYILNGMDEVPTQDSDDPVKSGGVFSAIDDVYSVMGQNGAKNLIPYPYYEKTHTENGITWTDKGDGTVTANGTATATSYFGLTSRTLGTNMANSLIEGESYILTGCPTGGSNQTYDIFINETYNSAEVGMAFDYGNGATFTLNHKTETNYGLGLRIRSGQTVSNLTFKPMLRLASDSDNTYQPYAKTNKQLTESKAELESVRDYVNELGVKNLIPYPYYRASGYSSNGMTTTYDSDGVLTINKVAGTSAAYFSLINNNQSPYYFKANTRYRLTLELENANDLSIFLSYNGTDVGSIRNKSTGTYEVIFTTPQTLEGRENMAIYAGASGTETNAKVKVMLQLASDINDDTYVPFAMTNKQLTDEIAAKADISDVPTALSELTDDSTHRLVTDAEKTTWNTVKNRVEANTFGSSVSLKSYSSATNKYIVPNDGYVTVYAGNGTEFRLYFDSAKVGFEAMRISSTDGYTRQSIFVKKGIKVYGYPVPISASSYEFDYYPLQ